MIRYFALAAVVLLWGCDGAAPDPAPAEAPPESAARSASTPSEQPELLPTPFDADQIRDEWVEGLALVMHTQDPTGESWERWRVVAADAEGADIEFTAVDAEGNALGEPRVERASWADLRDHAKYPAAIATREQVTRDTALGQLEGWLYTVRDGATGSETEMFFANKLPGAPLEMRMMKDDVVAMEMVQVERQKP